MNLNSISETLLRRRTTTSTQQQQNNVDTNNNGVGNTFGVNFSTSTLASALLISSMNQPSSPRPKKSTNNNGDHKENVEDNKTSSSRRRQSKKDDNTLTAKNNMPPPPPPPPPGPPPVRRSRNKKINNSLIDDTHNKPRSSSGNSKSIPPTLLQRRQMNPLSPVNNNSPMNRNQRGVDIGRRTLVKEQKSVNVSASDYTSHRSKAKSPIVAMDSLSQGERRRPIVSTTNSTRLPKRRTQNNLATEATRGITTPPNKKLVSPQSKRETSDHQVAIKSHTSTITHTTKSLSPAMKKIVAKYGSGSDCSVNHKLLTSPNISDRKQHQHDTIAKQQRASTTSNTLDTNRHLANKALQLKRNRQHSIQTNVINTKRKEANKKADIVKQFRQQKHRGRCNTSRAMKNDTTTSTTAAKEAFNDCSRVPRRRSLSVPRKTTKSLEDGLEEVDIQMDNLAVTQSCSFTTTHTTDTNVDNDETNKRRLQMRRKRAREVLARRNKKI